MKLFRKNNLLVPPEKKYEIRKDRLLLVLSGVLMGIGFPPFPFPFSLLLFVGLIPYFIVIEKKQTLGEINRATYLTFFIFTIITLYWVGSWQKQADPFLMIAGTALMFVNPLFFLIPSTLLYLARKSFPGRNVLFLFPLFWVTYEYLYMLTDLSFPWLTLGNGLAHFVVFIQIADVIGSVGISVIIIYINIFLYRAYINYKTNKRRFTVNLSSAFLIFVFVLSYGVYKYSTFKISKSTIKVGLIQPDLDPWAKWQGGNLFKLTDLYLDLSRQAANKGARLIVWPETALPIFLLDGSNQAVLDTIYKFINRNNVYLLTGMPDVKYYFKGDKIPQDAVEGNNGAFYYTTYNGILLLSPNSSRIQRYGKMKLVPFGERVPFVDTFPALGKIIKWGVGISGWNVGKDTTDFKIPASAADSDYTKKDSISIDGLVCYESIFPYFVTSFIRRGAKIITVVTNDSWYGNSSGPYQHKEISVLRAIENRRTVIRAANGGISCIIDPLGRTIVESKFYTKTYIVGDVHLENVETFFTKHPLIVPVISSGISLWVFGFFILLKLKEKLS